MQSLAVALDVAATEVKIHLQQGSAITRTHATFLKVPLLLLGRSLLGCWQTILHLCSDPLSSRVHASTFVPAAALSAQLLMACCAGSPMTSQQRDDSRGPSQGVEETHTLVRYCARAAGLFTAAIMQALRTHESFQAALGLTSDQHVQVLLLLDLAVAVTRLHTYCRGVSTVTVRRADMTSTSSSEQPI